MSETDVVQSILVALSANDCLVDLYPGTGAVTRAWETNTCTEHTCTYHDDTGNCMSWSSRSYPCQECAEWVRDAEPRKPAEKP